MEAGLPAESAEQLPCSIVETARSRVGQSQFRLGANAAEAPGVVDCSSFVQWVFRQHDIELPRYSRRQFDASDIIPIDTATAGDLLFRPGRVHTFIGKDGSSIGHVGIVADSGQVIHATNGGVRAESFFEFADGKPLRAGRVEQLAFLLR